MTETRETAPQTRFEPLPLPVLVLIVSVAKASDEHFARSCKSEEWWDCDECVDIYNRAHDQVMSVLDARDAMVRADERRKAVEELLSIADADAKRASKVVHGDDLERGQASGLLLAAAAIREALAALGDQP